MYTYKLALLNMICCTSHAAFVYSGQVEYSARGVIETR
jgi:hypothetical protein